MNDNLVDQLPCWRIECLISLAFDIGFQMDRRKWPSRWKAFACIVAFLHIFTSTEGDSLSNYYFVITASTLSWLRSYHKETSPLIFWANHWTGLYMIGAFVIKVVKVGIILRFFPNHWTFFSILLEALEIFICCLGLFLQKIVPNFFKNLGKVFIRIPLSTQPAITCSSLTITIFLLLTLSRSVPAK